MKIRIVALILCLISGSGSLAWAEQPPLCEHAFNAMTTRVTLAFTCLEEQPLNHSLYRAIEREFNRLNAKLNRYDPASQLSAANRQAAKEAVTIDGELMRLLVAAQRMSILSDGAFDITFASTGYLYDFRDGLQPTSKQLSVQAGLSYRNLVLGAADSTVRFTHPQLMLDLGGIAKGYAVDQAIELLQGAGVKSARVTAGGDTRLLGDNNGHPWMIAIKHPRAPERQAVMLPLMDTAISTSGDYERYFINEAGERVHHILSPETGKPVQGVLSATILAPTAMQSDALSTAVFVMGPERGIALINRLPDIDAIIIDERLKMHYSDGLMVPKG
ncbi:MAG: FAD:protein FMN transferase [Oleiphilaceae bacterium]|nr:FAD:protein FMN transferase [Oleiphilaceae bacterium]